jgi:carboxylesterase type B
VITRFVDKLRAAIPVTQHHLLDEIVHAYGLGKHVEEDEEEGTHENRDRNGFLCLIHDIMFYAPAEMIASAWPAGRSYLYHFNEPNPWPGRWQGHASHLTDLAFLWQNYEEALAPASRQVSRHFSADLISFINGRAPWTAYRAAESSPPMARIYGPSDNGSVAGVAVARSGACGRRQCIWKFIDEIGADLLYDVVMGSLL